MHLKGREQCFLMQVVMNKCFLLNPEQNKISRRSFLSFSRKKHFNSEKITSPSRRLGYSINQLNC